MSFRYDVSAMTPWLFSCPKQVSLKITFIVKLVRFQI